MTRIMSACTLGLASKANDVGFLTILVRSIITSYTVVKEIRIIGGGLTLSLASKAVIASRFCLMRLR